MVRRTALRPLMVGLALLDCEKELRCLVLRPEQRDDFVDGFVVGADSVKRVVSLTFHLSKLPAQPFVFATSFLSRGHAVLRFALELLPPLISGPRPGEKIIYLISPE